jgi:AcrR family transcriptional regulator
MNTKVIPPHPAHALPAAPAPLRQRRKEIRPQQLLEAALDLFVEKGFAATRSEEVAQRAGVAKGTLYLYYPSKEELFKEVVRQNLSSLIGEGAELVGAFEGSTAELLQCLVNVWWQRVGSSAAGGLHKIVLSEVRNFPELAQFYTDEVITPATQLFTRVLERGVARGEFRAVPMAEATLALMAPMIFCLLHQHSLGACPVTGVAVDHEAMLRTHIDLVLNGLRTPPATARVSG